MKALLTFFLQPMALVGLIGQCLFFSRFLVQWLASERRGESHVPVLFWYLSLAGGFLLFGYATWRQDPVIMLGQGVGIFVYVRNLMLIAKKRRGATRSGTAPP
jgi:lipid-A-disaccharide synthase-like uncharacterized protein